MSLLSFLLHAVLHAGYFRLSGVFARFIIFGHFYAKIFPVPGLSLRFFALFCRFRPFCAKNFFPIRIFRIILSFRAILCENLPCPRAFSPIFRIILPFSTFLCENLPLSKNYSHDLSFSDTFMRKSTPHAENRFTNRLLLPGGKSRTDQSYVNQNYDRHASTNETLVISGKTTELINDLCQSHQQSASVFSRFWIVRISYVNHPRINIP